MLLRLDDAEEHKRAVRDGGVTQMELRLQALKKLVAQRYHSALAVLGLANVETNQPVQNIDVLPSQCHYLAPAHPCVVRHRHDGPEVFRQRSEQLCVSLLFNE